MCQFSSEIWLSRLMEFFSHQIYDFLITMITIARWKCILCICFSKYWFSLSSFSFSFSLPLPTLFIWSFLGSDYHENYVTANNGVERKTAQNAGKMVAFQHSTIAIATAIAIAMKMNTENLYFIVLKSVE